MPGLRTAGEVRNLKLKSIRVPLLRQLAREAALEAAGNSDQLIQRLSGVPDDTIDQFIKQQYLQELEARQGEVPEAVLRRELDKVTNFSWGVVQGGLDQKIQRDFVRRYHSYEQLIEAVRGELYPGVESYAICTWYNHWTTVLIEDHISGHRNVVPTLKKIKGIDLFFQGQPFDLKITRLPTEFEFEQAAANPNELARWMYENQGAERFGEDPRFFVVLADPDNPEESWKLKRQFEFLFERIDGFLDTETVSQQDQIEFHFAGRRHTTIAKLLLITKE